MQFQGTVNNKSNKKYFYIDGKRVTENIFENTQINLEWKNKRKSCFQTITKKEFTKHFFQMN
jgi:uncharacterized protein (UPF0333 family)